MHQKIHSICLILLFTFVLPCCISSDDFAETSPDGEDFMDTWEYIHNIDFPNDGQSEPVKCSRIGRAASKLRWMFKSNSKSDNTVNFFLSTRKNRNSTLITNEALFDKKIVRHFHPKKTVYLIVHGWLSNASADWVVDMKDALLDFDDANVISIDWSSGGNTLKYWKAVNNIENVGTNIVTVVEQLMKITGIEKKNFHFIGHSLGAHISSFAASKLGGIRRITGLDPAHTCVITTNRNYLLDKTDADFVDVIHTSATMLVKFGFGTRSALGHVDFYPNGGEKQPECYERRRNPLSKLIPLYRSITAGVCNHGRAYDLFTESLKRKACPYVGHYWDRSWKSIQSSLNTPCTEENCSIMGIYADESPARGTFYVATKNENCVENSDFFSELLSSN